MLSGLRSVRQQPQSRFIRTPRIRINKLEMAYQRGFLTVGVSSPHRERRIFAYVWLCLRRRWPAVILLVDRTRRLAKIEIVRDATCRGGPLDRNSGIRRLFEQYKGPDSKALYTPDAAVFTSIPLSIARRFSYALDDAFVDPECVEAIGSGDDVIREEREQ